MPEQVQEVIRELEQRLRTQMPAVDWRAVVESALARMYPDNVAGLAAMVQVITSELDSRGQFDEALAELDHIAAFVRADANSLATVLGIRSGMLMAKGRSAEADALVRELDTMVPGLTSDRALATAVSSSLVVRLGLFDETAGDDAEAWMASGDKERAAQLFVASWHIPYLFATGDRVQARPWVRALKLQAQVVGHPWRRSDAVVFDFADARIGDWGAAMDGQVIAPNRLAASRVARIELFTRVRREEWDAAGACLEEIAEHVAALGADAIGGSEPFIAVFEAMRDGEIRTMPPMPERVHLGNVGAALAACEAVAYAGSPADAARWHTWWQGAIPRNVRSSLEWPSSAERVRGLLALRAGEPRTARRLLEAASRWSNIAKHRSEHALAQLQLAELLSSADFVVGEQKRLQIRRTAWSALRDVNVPPAAHVYAVGRAITEGPSGVTGSRLTQREIQVVSLLAEGLTYRAIGERLGVRWPTVQTLAHRTYEKLGVSGKMAAVATARELGIL